jgi:hypothetical protein
MKQLTHRQPLHLEQCLHSFVIVCTTIQDMICCFFTFHRGRARIFSRQSCKGCSVSTIFETPTIDPSSPLSTDLPSHSTSNQRVRSCQVEVFACLPPLPKRFWTEIRVVDSRMLSKIVVFAANSILISPMSSLNALFFDSHVIIVDHFGLDQCHIRL